MILKLLFVQIIRYILFPVAIFYGFVVELIKYCYQKKIFKTYSSKVPILNIGNLSTGGTGKTPHVAYLIELLGAKLKIVVLSRGYNRKTKGVLWVEPTSTAIDVGDEPLQLKKQFKEIPVVVSEKRALALPHIQQKHPDTQLILLDDAFQHWALQTPFKILLTTFDQPFFKDFVLPTGNLREFRKGYQRADIIVVTKCPETMSQTQKSSFQKAIRLKKHQKIFFSYYKYAAPKPIFGEEKLTLDRLKNATVIMVTAIANTAYLEKFIKKQTKNIIWIKYSDHYYFKEKDIEQIAEQYKKIADQNKLILTTEKDAIRLKLHQKLVKKHKLPIYSLPIKVNFAFGEEQAFQQAIADLLQKKG